MPDSVTYTSVNPIDFFRAKAQEAPSAMSRANMFRAVDALRRFVGGAEFGFDRFTEPMMDEWVARLLFQGYSPKTVSNNILKRLATLYNKAVAEGLAEPTDIFRTYQNRLDDETGMFLYRGIDRQTFSKLQKLIRQADHISNPGSRLAADILIFAVCRGGMTFDEIALFKKDDYTGGNELILDIIKRYSRPRGQYLFPLSQSSMTPRQRRRRVQLMIEEAASRAGLAVSPEADATTFDLWAMAAMGCGTPARDIAACLAGRPHHGPLAAIVTPPPAATDDTPTAAATRERVATLLSNNPMRWYAMHLRPHVDYDKLMTRLKERDITLGDVYYPMEQIVSKTGRKKVFETRPVISWLLFFRERVTRLSTLFDEIGDLAWGYRYHNDITSPYAAISNREIAEYQAALGTLTPDTPILPDEAIRFNEGDHLIVLGGAVNGRHGILISERHHPDRATGTPRVIYRIRLTDGHNANWIVDRDPRLVRKATPTP